MDDAVRFRAIFEGTYGAVRRFVHHRGVLDGQADDIVAETFLVAWRRLHDVPTDDPLPWLLAVARNVWLNQRRSNRRYDALVVRLPRPEPFPAPAEPPEAGAVDDIRRALAALSDDDQEILRLIAWDDLTPAQASQVIGCSSATFRVRLHRARQRLAAELAKRNGGSGQILDETTHQGGAR